MANLVIITGPMAVGKMTVAEALKEKIDYHLMVNHDSIEVSDKIFGFATPSQKEFNKLIRKAAFDTSIKYDESLIFTCVTDFNSELEYKKYKELEKLYKDAGGKFYFIELTASLEERLKRNVTPNRLEKKKSKQDIEWSNNNIINGETKYRLNTRDDEYWFDNHLKINNENLQPNEVTLKILETFNLEPEFKEKDENANKIYV